MQSDLPPKKLYQLLFYEKVFIERLKRLLRHLLLLPPSRQFCSDEEDRVVEVEVKIQGFQLRYSYRAKYHPLKALKINTSL